ncbi:uncharacterized protein LOC129601881 [Paramacrobiotus metropolitanus]|uniref:uncharacterized protein LOC129601881 n=1 Tax=Paramacrobiotus metropolitanus TaxID=2943436 RepID=UPI0024460B05|nr:uncharacterized protein LOC129601881 [Paramacrobiotus metropolitanus]
MWDWVTFGVCVAAVVPSVLLLAIFLRCILKNSDRRCFKGSSEDCEILISTTTRPRPTRIIELLHETTHRQVVGAGSPMMSSDPPPDYHSSLPPTVDEQSGSDSVDLISLLPPVYGSMTNLPTPLPPYGSIPNISSSIPFNINTIITSLDLLPEFATFPPPPTYDETIRIPVA